MDIKENNKQTPIRTTETLTRKQLEREISQSFYAFYRQTVGCSPQKVNCNLFANYLVIVAEEGITPLELTIKKSGEIEILCEMRRSINQVLKFRLKELVEEKAIVEVIDLICELNFDTGRIIATALLLEPPLLRSKK